MPKFKFSRASWLNTLLSWEGGASLHSESVSPSPPPCGASQPSTLSGSPNSPGEDTVLHVDPDLYP